MSAAILRPATEADAATLAELSRRAFAAKFAHLYAPDDLAAFFAEHKTAANYRASLADPRTAIHVAQADDRLVAYCLIEREHPFDQRPEPRPQRPVHLNQLYTDPEMTGRGFGAALMEWAIAEARAWQADAVQLSVFSENLGAQRFYQRYGFGKVADIDFWVGTHRDHEFLYELRL